MPARVLGFRAGPPKVPLSRVSWSLLGSLGLDVYLVLLRGILRGTWRLNYVNWGLTALRVVRLTGVTQVIPVVSKVLS